MKYWSILTSERPHRASNLLTVEKQMLRSWHLIRRMVITSYSCYYWLLFERVYRSTHRW